MAGNNLFVVDSSYILSVLLPDEKRLPAAKNNLKLITSKKNKIISSPLLEFEVGNGIRSALLRKRIKSNSPSILIKNFNLLPIKIEKIDNERVLSISITNNLSFYDATYLFLAKSRNAVLLTLDEKLFSLCKD